MLAPTRPSRSPLFLLYNIIIRQNITELFTALHVDLEVAVLTSSEIVSKIVLIESGRIGLQRSAAGHELAQANTVRL